MARQSWDRPLVLYLVVTAGGLLAGATMHALWPDWHWHHEPLHSAMEAVGGLVAMAMAVVLLQTPVDAGMAKSRALAAGFLGMGILEEFHAIVRPGDGFVLFRNMASLAGGIGFVLAWRSQADRQHVRCWEPWWIGTGARAASARVRSASTSIAASGCPPGAYASMPDGLATMISARSVLLERRWTRRQSSLLKYREKSSRSLVSSSSRVRGFRSFSQWSV